MHLQHLRFVREIVRHQFNLTHAANALHTSQPGVSAGLSELEKTLGITIFARASKRLLGFTPEGKAAYTIIEKILTEVNNLQHLSADFTATDSGSLTIATTHTQARYVLPRIVKDFMAAYPKVKLSILELSPPQIVDHLLAGSADIGLATEAIGHATGLIAQPCYQWQHCLIVPKAHPLVLTLNARLARLDDLMQYPLITYEPAFAGRRAIDSGFANAALQPEIVLQAMDADVIKTYVNLGLGIGIISEIAHDDEDDALLGYPLGHLFGNHTALVGLKRGSSLRNFGYYFLSLLSPRLTRTAFSEQNSE